MFTLQLSLTLAMVQMDSLDPKDPLQIPDVKVMLTLQLGANLLARVDREALGPLELVR